MSPDPYSILKKVDICHFIQAKSVLFLVLCKTAEISDRHLRDPQSLGHKLTYKRCESWSTIKVFLIHEILSYGAGFSEL
jgi:hypothetical protein